jgi:subtilase family serine protease
MSGVFMNRVSVKKASVLVSLLTSAVAFSTLTFAATADRISGPITGPGTVPLSGSVHRKAQPQYDRGPAAPTIRFGSMMLLTTPTAGQLEDLKAFTASQQDRKSPNYHKWLTPEQWADRFGLSQNDISQITRWLKSQGFSVGYVARGRNWIAFSGTAAQVESAFHTQIHYFNVNGEEHIANATAPKIPTALADVVTGIRGLDDFHLKPRAVRNARAAVSGRPDYYDNIFAAPAPPDFLAPGDIATIYDINTLYSAGIDGTGQKLAIIGQTDIFLTDINDFRSGFGLATIPTSDCTTNPSTGVITSCNSTNFAYVLAEPAGFSDPGTPSLQDLTEADLDIEWSGATARNAQIIFVNSPINSNGSGTVYPGVWFAWYYAVDNVTAPVISMSYGGCEFDDNNVLQSNGQPGADEIELMSANNEGITFFNSSGDSGAAECDAATNSSTNNLAVGGLAISYPASSPEVTGVGGTAVEYPTGFSTTYWSTTNGANGGSAQNPPIPETTWNDDEELALAYGNTQEYWQQNYAIVSGGGGFSNCAEQTSDNSDCVSGFPQPSWQAVTVPNQAAVRFSPDVSLLASPNFPGYIFCTPEEAWFESSTSTTSTCSSGISGALSLTDPSNGNQADPSLVGGTSASSPIFAGIVTLMNQYLNGSSSSGLGNINPTLYSLATTSGVFHQVTTGNNNVYCESGTPADPWPATLQCTSGIFGFSASNADTSTGYNLATGLGSVDADNLAQAWGASLAVGDTFQLTSSISGGTLTVIQGQTGTVNITLTSSNFINTSTNSTILPVTYTCSGLPTEATCTFTPGSTTQSVAITLNIATTAPTTELKRPLDRGSKVFFAILMPGLLGIAFTFGARKRSIAAMRVVALIALLGASTFWMASCGGNSSSNNTSNAGTPPGNYTITVNAATSGASPITASPALTFTLTVSGS